MIRLSIFTSSKFYDYGIYTGADFKKLSLEKKRA